MVDRQFYRKLEPEIDDEERPVPKSEALCMHRRQLLIIMALVLSNLITLSLWLYSSGSDCIRPRLIPSMALPWL